MRWFDRVFVGLTGFVYLLLTIILGGIGFNWIPAQAWPAFFGYFYDLPQIQGIALAACAASVFLALRFFILTFHREETPKGVLQMNSWGSLNITLETLHHLIQHVVRQVKGVNDVVIKTRSTETGELNVHLKLTVDGEKEFPRMVEEVQTKAKKHLEEIAGVPVNEIHVVISKVSTSSRTSPAYPKQRVK